MSDRKYRQRGYQDDGRDTRSSSQRTSSSPKRPSDGPRGRGLGAPGSAEFRCNTCNAVQPSVDVAFEASCDSCGGALHTCRNCRHFDAAAPNECRQPIPVRIAGKTTANECESFDPKLIQSVGSADEPSDAKSAFDALFDL